MTRPGIPRIAVIIPCYNDGRTLPDAVRSALEQEPCQVVVVNDGSTDGDTQRVCTELASERVRVIHQENHGLAGARMTGVKATEAPYIFPLDADDYLLSRSLTILADYLDTHPDVGLTWGRYRFAGEKTHAKDVAAVLDPWQVTYFNDLPVATLVRRDVLAAAGGWQLANGYEDADLWMSLAERGVTGRGLPDLIYCHRIHGDRMARDCIQRHAELYGALRARHQQLFAARPVNRRRSAAPRAAKVLVPIVDSLGMLSEYRRMSLAAHVFRLTDRTRRTRYRAALRRRLRPATRPSST